MRVLIILLLFAGVGRFGPQNYYQCILMKIEKGGSFEFVQKVLDDCDKSFPNKETKKMGLGMFGPQTADECIAIYTKNVKGDEAREIVKKACERLFLLQ
ncbi:MAG: hypothetical protein IT291_03225 [Deltaproteobacteria bacterium]|nr:hypothetical protein [Deltaproteobacteria bacterium]